MSRGKSSTKKKRRRRSQRQAIQENIRRRFKKNFPRQQVVVGPTSDGVKMSEVLEEFVEPYMEFVKTEEAYRKLLTAAVVAWNVMLFPVKDRSSRLDELVVTLPCEVREDGRKIIKELMERKERFFARYKRMIIDFEVTDTGEDWHLSVMSTAAGDLNR